MKRYRSVWISDLHLGMRHAQVNALLHFLRETECRYLYIVGDFIDGWQLSASWYWSDQYNVLIQKLLRKNRRQTRVTLITGNHDEFLEKFAGIRFGSLNLVERAMHTGADGKRYLVIHGHQADGISRLHGLLERVGARLYNLLLSLNVHFNKVRRRLGFGYWSFSAYLKSRAKSAVNAASNYEDTLVQLARNEKVDGVICGHIHRPEIKTIDGMMYLNCGDWVESCTALVEEFDGQIRLLFLKKDFELTPEIMPSQNPAAAS